MAKYQKILDLASYVCNNQEARHRDGLTSVPRPILSMWQFDSNNGKNFHLVTIKDLRNLSIIIFNQLINKMGHIKNATF